MYILKGTKIYNIDYYKDNVYLAYRNREKVRT